MRIAYIAAGAGGMYCGSCIHDNSLAAALQRRGHDVALIPTYTPLRTDETNVSMNSLFFGGLNVYLQEKYAIFRKTPDFIEKLLNRPALINWLSGMSARTNARDLGNLTISVLKGEEGNQRKELEKLVSWLKQEYRPDIVQLTNSMFLGFAREIKRELGIPVLCLLQGEDLFLEDLIEPFKSQARALLKEKTGDVDAFVATSDYYADFMSDYLEAPRDKMHVVRLGINLQGHGDEDLQFKKDSLVVGYLARVCPEKGLHNLVEAFHIVRGRFGPGKVKLKVAGYLGKRDQAYFLKLKQRIASLGWEEDFEYVGEVDRLGKIAFLNMLDVLSIPTVYHESKGLSVLEALANGIPVVQPGHGLFPEIIELTGGGLVVEPDSPDALADGIERLLRDPELRNELGQKGKAVVHRELSDETMATATLDVFEKYLNLHPELAA